MSENTRFIVLKVIQWLVAIVIIGYVVRLLPEIYRLLPELESRVVKLISLTLGICAALDLSDQLGPGSRFHF